MCRVWLPRGSPAQDSCLTFNLGEKMSTIRCMLMTEVEAGCLSKEPVGQRSYDVYLSGRGVMARF